MTKEELRAGLLKGAHLEDLLHLSPGQDCMIFKAEQFTPGDDVIYIPDIGLNEIPVDINLGVHNSMAYEFDGKWPLMTKEEQVNVVLSYCYTGKDFVGQCEGDEALAYRLFCYCDWQHPSSAIAEVEYDDEEDKKWAEEMYASFVSTRGCTTSTTMTCTNTAE